jgi:VanZ family protein
LLLPGASPETLAALHAALRKLAHVTEYAILAVLVCRALEEPRRLPRTVAAAAFALCAAYAALDELHQTFVPSRTGSPLDVALDVGGAALGIALRAATSGLVSADRRSPA